MGPLIIWSVQGLSLVNPPSLFWQRQRRKQFFLPPEKRKGKAAKKILQEQPFFQTKYSGLKYCLLKKILVKTKCCGNLFLAIQVCVQKFVIHILFIYFLFIKAKNNNIKNTPAPSAAAKKSTDVTICIGQDILCLPDAFFFIQLQFQSSTKKYTKFGQFTKLKMLAKVQIICHKNIAFINFQTSTFQRISPWANSF